MKLSSKELGTLRHVVGWGLTAMRYYRVSETNAEKAERICKQVLDKLAKERKGLHESE